MIRTQLGMSPGQLGPREPIQAPIVIRSFASPATTQQATVTVTPPPETPQPDIGVPENIISPPAQSTVILSAAPAPTIAPAPAPSGTIIPGVPDEYTYIGGGILLFLLFSSMKHRR